MAQIALLSNRMNNMRAALIAQRLVAEGHTVLLLAADSLRHTTLGHLEQADYALVVCDPADWRIPRFQQLVQRAEQACLRLIWVVPPQMVVTGRISGVVIRCQTFPQTMAAITVQLAQLRPVPVWLRTTTVLPVTDTPQEPG